MGNSPSTADIQDYRDGYPGKRDDPGADKNLQFYRLQIRTIPGRNMLTDFHTSCADGGRRGDYEWLEWDDLYIQWLFPIREGGLNWQAQELQLHEARAIAADPLLQGRIIDSYETMLDFYGMELVDRRTGEVRRQPPGRFEARYRNLNESSPPRNNHRITRILKCLGEVDLEHLKRPFVEHVLRECYQHRLLRCRDLCIDYWAQTLVDEADRRQVERWCRALHDEHGPPLASEIEVHLPHRAESEMEAKAAASDARADGAEQEAAGAEQEAAGAEQEAPGAEQGAAAAERRAAEAESRAQRLEAERDMFRAIADNRLAQVQNLEQTVRSLRQDIRHLRGDAGLPQQASKAKPQGSVPAPRHGAAGSGAAAARRERCHPGCAKGQCCCAVPCICPACAPALAAAQTLKEDAAEADAAAASAVAGERAEARRAAPHLLRAVAERGAAAEPPGAHPGQLQWVVVRSSPARAVGAAAARAAAVRAPPRAPPSLVFRLWAQTVNTIRSTVDVYALWIGAEVPYFRTQRGWAAWAAREGRCPGCTLPLEDGVCPHPNGHGLRAQNRVLPLTPAVARGSPPEQSPFTLQTPCSLASPTFQTPCSLASPPAPGRRAAAAAPPPASPGSDWLARAPDPAVPEQSLGGAPPMP